MKLKYCVFFKLTKYISNNLRILVVLKSKSYIFVRLAINNIIQHSINYLHINKNTIDF